MNEKTFLCHFRLFTSRDSSSTLEKPSKEECQVPHDWLFPFCESKIQYIQQLWGTNAECYVNRHKLKPENLCSAIIYLSEVERFCPLLPWRRRNSTSTKEPKLAEMRFELDQAFIDTLNKLNLRWMRDRITRMWPQWVAAAKQFTAEGSLRRKHHVKKIFIFFGTYAYQPMWLDMAFTGAPLGEMVQWSDLIAALYILGHDVTLSVNSTTYQSYMSPPKSPGCSDVFEPEFDLIYTDYNGFTYMLMHITPNLSPYMLAKGKREYLDTLHKYLEIHGTFFAMSEAEIKKNVPEYVIAHGILSKPDLEKLLQETKVFIGLGFPYEGPAPLEAIAQGCIFLNAKFDPPHNRLNTRFFKVKPTLRNLTSQHPYAEVFIGKPHVFTVDISNLSHVEEALKEILKTENFCEHIERWPPLSEMMLLMGAAGKSCVDVCKERELLCEPTFFVDINTTEDLKKFGMKCSAVETKESLLAPSYDVSTHMCTLQKQPVLFTCLAKEPSARRLCPCRDFQTQQVAFCKQCH
ncbi:hypothetical protein pdam_00020016 [Pocillopora damicornis]|uniref:alpha-1,6-mannosyl-glycoprotein 6-beta-N-acetylglucosaminyltransferase n=1 Tax=Pocillopora damicornis TaxID=46731 RepID=A0A3M6UW68_POCDA|nr:hypothetical protein pdam_00020016 [Pocillopora damicornis]